MGNMQWPAALRGKRREKLPEIGPLPEHPDEGITGSCSCEVLRTTKGLLKGSWASFDAVAFYRALPGGREDGLRTIRHLLIAALDIGTYAEREGERVEVDMLGEGSYSRVFGCGQVAAKVISDRERPWVHRAAVENSLQADRAGLGPAIYGHGRLNQTLGGSFQGTVLFMERLDALGESWSEGDTAALLGDVQKLATVGFHNDLKLPNLLRRHGRPVLIDFDLMSAWAIKVAVTSSCIEHDFQALLEPQGMAISAAFREYYDLFILSVTLQDSPLYRAVLKRLAHLWGELEAPVLRPLLERTDPEKLQEVPFEALVRVPLQAVTVNLLDLRGNLFAHLKEAKASADGGLPAECLALPQLIKSNGVYWP